MQTIVGHEWDDPPTKRIENVQSKTLVALSRIERLANLAAERLSVSPDADAIVEAIGDLARIAELARAVSR